MNELRLLAVLVLLTGCNWRTPSNIRFSKDLDIKFPENIEIIRDEYQDMWQDYTIVYELKLTRYNCAEMVKSIQKSKFYNPDVFVLENFSTEMYSKKDGTNGVWARTKNGYVFSGYIDQRTFEAKIDTIELSAEFIEGSD